MAKSTTSKREPKRQDDFDQENDSQDDDIFGTAISTVKSKQVKKQKVEVKQVKRFKDTAKKPAKPKQSVQEVKKVVEEEEEEVPLAVKKTRKVSEKPASEDKVTVKSPVFSAPSAFLSPRKSLGGQDTQDLSLKIEMVYLYNLDV